MEPLATHPNGETAAIARGLLQHFRDDSQFHKTRAFAETTLELSAAIRRVLDADSGFRPSFLGHVLVEVLLIGPWRKTTPAGWMPTIWRWNRSFRGLSRRQSTACRPAPPTAWPP